MAFPVPAVVPTATIAEIPGPSETLEMFARYGGFIGLLMAVIILGMGVAVYFLWRHNATLQDRLLEVQNKRVEEAKEVRAAMIEQAHETNEALRVMTSALQSLKDAVMMSVSPKR